MQGIDTRTYKLIIEISVREIKKRQKLTHSLVYFKCQVHFTLTHRNCDLRVKARMAVSQFSSMSSRSSEAFVQCDSSLSRFIGLGSRNRTSKQKLLLIRTFNSRPPTTSFCIKCVSSQPKPKSKEEGPIYFVYLFISKNLKFYYGQVCFFFFFWGKKVIIGSDDHHNAMLALRKDWGPPLGEM